MAPSCYCTCSVLSSNVSINQDHSLCMLNCVGTAVHSVWPNAMWYPCEWNYARVRHSVSYNSYTLMLDYSCTTNTQQIRTKLQCDISGIVVLQHKLYQYSVEIALLTVLAWCCGWWHSCSCWLWKHWHLVLVVMWHHMHDTRTKNLQVYW